jgi:hypothetical protein
MPAADQPAATATHVIPIGMDMPVSLPLMPLYAKVMGDSRRHKHQRAIIPAMRQILCNIQTSLFLRGPMLLIISTRTTLPCSADQAGDLRLVLSGDGIDGKSFALETFDGQVNLRRENFLQGTHAAPPNILYLREE